MSSSPRVTDKRRSYHSRHWPRSLYRLVSLSCSPTHPSAADLTPFILPLVGPGRSVSDMLLAHTRVTLNPATGARHFSLR